MHYLLLSFKMRLILILVFYFCKQKSKRQPTQEIDESGEGYGIVLFTKCQMTQTYLIPHVFCFLQMIEPFFNFFIFCYAKMNFLFIYF